MKVKAARDHKLRQVVSHATDTKTTWQPCKPATNHHKQGEHALTDTYHSWLSVMFNYTLILSRIICPWLIAGETLQLCHDEENTNIVDITEGDTSFWFRHQTSNTWKVHRVHTADDNLWSPSRHLAAWWVVKHGGDEEADSNDIASRNTTIHGYLLLYKYSARAV